jgi:hypothetical protein
MNELSWKMEKGNWKLERRMRLAVEEMSRCVSILPRWGAAMLRPYKFDGCSGVPGYAGELALAIVPFGAGEDARGDFDQTRS